MKTGNSFSRWMAAVVLTAISTCAFAKSYPLYVCNMQVTDGNRQQLTTLLSQMGYLKSGSITFDGDKTLVLNNAVVDFKEKGIARFLSNGKLNDFEGILLENGINGLIVKVEGTNKVTVTAQTDVMEGSESMPYAMAVAITMASESYTFEGSGSLTVNALCEDNTLDYSMGYAFMEYGQCRFRGGTYTFHGKTAGMLTSDKVFFDYGDITFIGDDFSALIGHEEDFVLSPFMKWVTPENPVFFNSMLYTESGDAVNMAKIGPSEGIDLSVGGQRVTAFNYDDILGDGNVYYDIDQNTLVLDGATITTYEAGIEASDMEGLNIELKGNNVIGDYGSGKCPYIALGKNATISGIGNATLTVRVRDGIFFIDKLTLNNVAMNVRGAYHAFSGSTTESGLTAELAATNGTTIDAYNEYDYEAVMNRLELIGDEVTTVLLPANAETQPDLLQYYDGRHVVVGNPGNHYFVALCGWNLNEGNKSYLEEGLTTQGFLKGGSIGFDESTFTLRLNGVTIESLMDIPVIQANCGFNSAGEKKLNVELTGNNIIKSGRTSAIHIDSEATTPWGPARLTTTFKGGGSLTVDAGYSLFSGQMAGIESEGDGNVNFTGGTYNLKGLGFGVKTGGQLFLSGVSMTAEGDDCAVAFGNIQMENVDVATPQDYTITSHYSYSAIADKYGNDAKKVVFTSSMPTTINHAAGTAQTDNGPWRSTDGRLLNSKPVQKGVYINNGKKVVVNK
ncbi:MAG: hypothetical protein IJ928_11790 [Prevotella sp.]|nr:hypothetical protein [Prevotella sp.]